MKKNIRLALSENRYGPSKKILLSILKEVLKIKYYPDDIFKCLICKIAEYNDVSKNMILAGNGLDELILLTCLMIDKKGGCILTNEKTFKDINYCAQILKKEIIEIELVNNRINYENFIDAYQKIIKEGKKVDLIYVCNPHNPTGSIAVGDFVKLCKITQANDTLIFVDEAYSEYVTDESFNSASEYINRFNNIIIGHSFSKIGAIAGLRCGYIISHEDTIRALMEIKKALPYSVNRLACVASISLLSKNSFIEKCRRKNKINKYYMYEVLEKVNLKYLSTQTNFILIYIGNEAEEFCDYLKNNNIIVMNASKLGFEGYIRIGIGKKVKLIKLLVNIKSSMRYINDY